MTGEELIRQKIGTQDFTVLANEAAYARYFDQLHYAIDRLHACYTVMALKKRNASKEREAATMAHFLQKLLFTTEVLKIKYAYRMPIERPLWVDLSDSGFPNFAELAHFESDVANRSKQLKDMPTEARLKSSMIDYMLQKHAHPDLFLSQISHRTYLEMLDPEKLFMPFNQGALELVTSNETTRRYVYTWACYDFATNRPYVHILEFEQDTNAETLERYGHAYDEFVAIIKNRGSRTQPIGVLATEIDNALESIHPKHLQRICIGPFYSELTLKERGERIETKEQVLLDVLRRAARDQRDSLIFFTNEIVISERQEVKGNRLTGRRVREVLYMTPLDTESFARYASFVQYHVLLPHHVLQQIGAAEIVAMPELGSAIKLVYNEKGVIYAI
ncbi:MAG: hypothetical protein Q8R40_03675 [bacterium]|nr:hypothetical protein [bacterium]